MARVKRKTTKKAAATSSTPKHHWKRPGFNAFGAHSSPAVKRGKIGIKQARCVEVEPPETGIHSLAWASTIVPQNCGLLKLPVEVRHKIWSLVFENLSCGNEPIRPMKKGMKFYSPTWPEAPKETAALSETCRQIYVDVVGGGLLYRAKQFSFTPGLMLNYLWVINPVHKNSIRSIHLTIKVPGNRNLTLPKKAFKMLAELPGLQDLHLEFNVDNNLCAFASYYIYPHHGSPHNTYTRRRIPEAMITTIRTCSSLREIKGLQSLRVDFVTYDRERTDRRDSFGYAIYEYNKVLLSRGSGGAYYDLQEELQKVMVAQK